MAEIKYFVYCEGVQNIPTPKGPKINMVGPLMVLTPPFIPGTYSFSISFGIQGFDHTINNKLQIILKDPSGKEVQDTGVVELPIAPKGNLPSKYSGISLNMDFRNSIINSEGEYGTTLIFNDEILGTFKIPVIKSRDIK